MVMYPVFMKLVAWAKKNGLSYKTAYRLFKAGKLPLPAFQLSTGTIIVEAQPVNTFKGVALYARVSSHDQHNDLKRQMDRLKDYAASKGWTVIKEVKEIGSGLNGSRSKLILLLKDKSISGIVVEHKDRLSRFGTEMLEVLLQTSDRSLYVMNTSEYKEDLVQDFVDVVTSMCAKIYGRRSAKNRAKQAVKAAENL
jgi:putative resolvase